MLCGWINRGRRGGAVGGALAAFAGPAIQCLAKRAFEHFHDAVGVGVVVDWRAFAWRPD